MAGSIGPTRTNGPSQEAHAPGRPGGGGRVPKGPHACKHAWRQDKGAPIGGPGAQWAPNPRQSLPGAHHGTKASRDLDARLSGIDAPAGRTAREEQEARNPDPGRGGSGPSPRPESGKNSGPPAQPRMISAPCGDKDHRRARQASNPARPVSGPPACAGPHAGSGNQPRPDIAPGRAIGFRQGSRRGRGNTAPPRGHWPEADYPATQQARPQPEPGGAREPHRRKNQKTEARFSHEPSGRAHGKAAPPKPAPGIGGSHPPWELGERTHGRDEPRTCHGTPDQAW